MARVLGIDISAEARRALVRVPRSWCGTPSSNERFVQFNYTTFDAWRNEAIDWVTTTPGLKKRWKIFASKWGDRDPGRAGYTWPFNTPCLDLLYALVHWMPELHDDPEGQVYLEVFTRQLGAAEQVSGFKSRVVSDPANQDVSDTSVKHLLQFFLAPIAAGSAKVDEELIESFPRDRLNILSIHQSKGLEFPLTIVDVGSDFSRNHHAHAFKRYPNAPGPTQTWKTCCDRIARCEP